MRKLEITFSDNPNLSINSNLRRLQFAFIAGVAADNSNTIDWHSCDNSMSECDNSNGTGDQTFYIQNQIN